MNILLLLKSFNYPPRNGGDQAVFNAINRMSSVVNFHLIGTDGSKNGVSSVESFKHDYPQIPTKIIELGKKNTYQKIKDICIRVSNYINNRNGNKHSVDFALLNSYDAQIDYYDELYRFLNKYITDNDIDVVQSEFHFTLGWLKGITAPVKKVFVHHELQFVVNYQRLMQREHTDDDIYFYKQQKQQEINALNACDAIITLSEIDRQKLMENGVHTPIFASFAQITLRNIKIEYPIKLKKRLVFIGPESHMPNKQGMQWFLDNVWERVLADEPTTELAVIGRWSKNTIEDWCTKYSNLQFLGYVDELHGAIKNSILIVPLFQGSGIRMKILEACSFGIPFVSTTVGAEGLGFTDGINACITDDAYAFARGILNLINDVDLASEFVSRSIKHIRKNFNDERFVESRLLCYQSF